MIVNMVWLAAMSAVCFFHPVAAKTANYSVQLLADIAPEGWSAQAWAAAADTMIGKTQSHILWDMIEDLGIQLGVTEDSIRAEIDSSRERLDLSPLPPREVKKKNDFLEKYTRSLEEFAHFLPHGWTEEKYEDHTPDDVAALSEEDAEKLNQRQLYTYTQNPNLGYLESLPKSVIESITSTIHEYARKAAGASPGARVYKRSVAPLVQIVSLQQFSPFGFFLFRTSYANQTLWESFFKKFDEVIDVHLGDTISHGEGMDIIKDEWETPLVDDPDAEGMSFEDCRESFRAMRDENMVGPGHDVGVFLVIDEETMQKTVDFDRSGELPYVWAVDADFKEGRSGNPEGYEGAVKVRIYALVHHLYVALGSDVLTPAKLWTLTQSYKMKKPEGHDEL